MNFGHEEENSSLVTEQRWARQASHGLCRESDGNIFAHGQQLFLYKKRVIKQITSALLPLRVATKLNAQWNFSSLLSSVASLLEAKNKIGECRETFVPCVTDVHAVLEAGNTYLRCPGTLPHLSCTKDKVDERKRRVSCSHSSSQPNSVLLPCLLYIHVLIALFRRFITTITFT